MAIQVRCTCGQLLTASEAFAGRRAQCPACGRSLRLPEMDPVVATVVPEAEETPRTPINDYLDPPSTPIPPADTPSPWRRMLEAMLDPRSIQWMLTFGGGLLVLGLLVWLASWGIFENPVVLAVLLGAGTLALLGAGWWIVLKTRFRVAGQALTFLACVVAPLNLWFYHAQGLITLGDHLWIGGVVCCLLYVATVYVLRDPLFLYAVEVGVTLTVGLLWTELGWASDATALALALMSLALLSIHAERTFPAQAEVFDRRRFGLPLFWSGHVQLAGALLLLLAVQSLGWALQWGRSFDGQPWYVWHNGLLQHSVALAVGLWLVAAYAYLYSDLVVRRSGVYVYLAAFSFVLAEISLIGMHLSGEWLLAILALTGLAANLIQPLATRADDRLSRAFPPLALALSGLPIAVGIVMHLRATSDLTPAAWRLETGWPFVAAMVWVAVCHRISAFLCRKTSPHASASYFFGSAAAVLVAAAGALRMQGLKEWSDQAPWLMALPILYLLASRLWRGHSPERPLARVAHAATAIIVLAGIWSALETTAGNPILHPRQGQTANLLLGIVFSEAAVFYALAAALRRRGRAFYLAAAAACGALWQFMGYGAVAVPYEIALFAVLGVGFLVLARLLGVREATIYRPSGWQATVLEGRGLAAYQAGNAVVSIAILAAILYGLSQLAVKGADWPLMGALALTIVSALVAAMLACDAMWRRIHITGAVAVAAVAFLVLNLLSHLSLWRKLEIFCVLLGLGLLVFSSVGRFRETDDARGDLVSVGLWLGSLLVCLPLLLAICASQASGIDPTLYDQLALLVITIAMVVTGYSWQVKSTTILGGGTLVFYLLQMVVLLGWRHQPTIGVTLTILGAAVFGCGIVLSVYRQKLLELPEHIAKHEGLFRLLDWR